MLQNRHEMDTFDYVGTKMLKESDTLTVKKGCTKKTLGMFTGGYCGNQVTKSYRNTSRGHILENAYTNMDSNSNLRGKTPAGRVEGRGSSLGCNPQLQA